MANPLYDRTAVVLCACGCGQTRMKYDINRQERHFIVGHTINSNMRPRRINQCIDCGKPRRRGAALRCMTCHNKAMGIQKWGDPRRKIGTKHGRLLIISIVEVDGHSCFKCLCECGKEKILPPGNLKRTFSCGCLNSEVARQNMLAMQSRPGFVRYKPPKTAKERFCCDCGKELHDHNSLRCRSCSQFFRFRKDGKKPKLLCNGYPVVRISKHRYAYEHKVRAEKALGNRLPPKAIVHHHSKTELVICQDQAYHLFLHRRYPKKRRESYEADLRSSESGA